MFLPIGDVPNPSGFRPWVSWALIGANVLVFLLITMPLAGTPASPNDPLALEYARQLLSRLPQESLASVLQHVSAYDLYVLEHGFKPGAPRWADLFSSLFLHGSFMHLAGNMLFLWIYGDNVEHRLGRGLYLLAYLGSGVIATLAFAAFNQASMLPLVGASGAISGVLGLYFLMFPRNKVKVFVFFFPFLMNTILVPARLVLGFFLIFDNLLPILFRAESSVAFGAHLGGFGAGLLFAWAFEKASWWRPRRRAPKAAGPATVISLDPSPLARALRAGDRATAVDLAFRAPLSEIYALPPAEVLRLAEWLAIAQHPQLAVELLRHILSSRASTVDQARVYLTLGLVRLQQGQITSAYQHLLSVLDFNPDAETEDRAREALHTISLRGGRPS